MKRDPFDSHDLAPGDVVSIPFGPGHVMRHFGIVTHSGTVISNSRRNGGVVEQSFDAFADGRRVRRHERGHPDEAIAIEARARRYLGSEYDLTGSNCVHLVRRSHGRSPTALQVGRATVQTLGDMIFGSRRRY